MKKQLLGALCAAVLTFVISTTADAALLSRLGGQACYDTVLDITWTADADINGQLFWDDQVA